MSTKRVYNFNAGPSTLPLEVIEEIRDGFTEFGGMSVLEISHRSKTFDAILDEAKALLAELMGIPDGYQLLFLQGGASLQFAMIPMNLMPNGADYAVTGHWAENAFSEAKKVGNARLAFSSKETGYNRVPNPGEINLNKNADYLHITTNNTIYGTQYHYMPDTGQVPLVVDMSSDILSRAVNVSRCGLIYAGAQKNIGVAGLTVVIIRDDLVKKSAKTLPDILSYSTHAEAKSIFHTPPVMAIYITLLVLKWIKKRSLAVIEKDNEKKAGIIYDVIDRSKLYRGHAEKDSRSRMNIVFTMPTDEMTDRFVAEAKKHDIVGIKGHRSTGGIRASLYNAMTMDGANALADFMRDFERRQ